MADTALVTGCSTGIGREIARAFLADGWRVYATARDPADVERLGDRGAATAKLDVTSTEDAERAIERVVDEEGRLDCLVNNAGYGQFGPVEDVPTAAVREQFDVNAFGPHRLMRAALPHMRARGRGTIINVTSAADGLTLPGIGVYTGSKFALASISRAVRQEVADQGIDVAVVEPGLVATDFYDRALAEIESVEHSRAYTDLYRVLGRIGAVERGGPGINPPRTVARTVLDAANAAEPSPRYRVGPYSRLGVAAATILPEPVLDRLARTGVRLAASGPVQRALRWWEGRGDRTVDRERLPGE